MCVQADTYIYICMCYVHIYTWDMYIYICMCLYTHKCRTFFFIPCDTWDMGACMYRHIHTYMYITHVYICTQHIHTYMYVSAYIHINVAHFFLSHVTHGIRTYIYVCAMYIYTHGICTYIYVCAYICMCLYTHKCRTLFFIPCDTWEMYIYICTCYLYIQKCATFMCVQADTWEQRSWVRHMCDMNHSYV